MKASRHKRHKKLSSGLLCFLFFLCFFVANAQVLGDPVDVSADFQRLENVYFIGSRVTSWPRFCFETGSSGRKS